jgi:TolA-binding protein
MKTRLPLYLAIAGIGAAIALFLQEPSVPEPQAADPALVTASKTAMTTPTTDTPDQTQADVNNRLDDLSKQLRQLQETLKQESASRQDLQQQVSQLKDNVKLLASSKPATSEENQNREIHTRPITNTSQPAQWFDAQVLVKAGVDESEAHHIRDVYEDVEMQKLYLRDKAIREGWIGDERYQKERAKLDAKQDSLRDELGDKAYDAYLYAAGEPNRVIIVSSLENSPARNAGIRAGDTVLRYDNKRIYSWGDLRKATTEGQPDAMVPIDLIRDGNPLTVYVPRGPMGVQLDNKSVAPQ